MKITILTLLLFSTTFSFAQESENYFINRKGEKVMMYGEVQLSPTHVKYYDEKKKWQSYQQNRIERMVVYNRYFINLPVSRVVKALHEVIGFDDNHILTAYWHNRHYLYVYDRNLNPVKRKVALYSKPKDQMKTLERLVKHYFNACTPMLAAMEENIRNNEDMLENISYFNCDSRDLFGME